MEVGSSYSFTSSVCWAQQQPLFFLFFYCTQIQTAALRYFWEEDPNQGRGLSSLKVDGGGGSSNLVELKNSRWSQAHGSMVSTHLVVLSMESDCSACSRAWEASEGAGSGSGFRMRNKRKQPTRLITVREMNTVWRSLSETWVRVLKQHLLLVGSH